MQTQLSCARLENFIWSMAQLIGSPHNFDGALDSSNQGSPRLSPVVRQLGQLARSISTEASQLAICEEAYHLEIGREGRLGMQRSTHSARHLDHQAWSSAMLGGQLTLQLQLPGPVCKQVLSKHIHEPFLQATNCPLSSASL